MHNYRGLAAVYDYLVSGVDFGQWIEYVESIMNHFGFTPRSVLDLACGTGNTLIPFAEKGYRATGVDISPEMIGAAIEKTSGMGLKIEYHVGDITEFLIKNPVELATCFHDGLNYILEPERLKKVFKNTYRNIGPGGMFIFDLNALNWIGDVDGRPEVVDEEEVTIIYRTGHDTGGSLWTVNITCFIKDGDIYRKFTEIHRERGYGVREVQKMLEEAGFMFLAVYDGFTFDPPHNKSRRHFYAARRP